LQGFSYTFIDRLQTELRQLVYSLFYLSFSFTGSVSPGFSLFSNKPPKG
jgi:hypothetical protein